MYVESERGGVFMRRRGGERGKRRGGGQLHLCVLCCAVPVPGSE